MALSVWGIPKIHILGHFDFQNTDVLIEYTKERNLWGNISSASVNYIFFLLY